MNRIALLSLMFLAGCGGRTWNTTSPERLQELREGMSAAEVQEILAVPGSLCFRSVLGEHELEARVYWATNTYVRYYILMRDRKLEAVAAIPSGVSDWPPPNFPPLRRDSDEPLADAIRGTARSIADTNFA